MPSRSADQWFSEYAASHQNPTNKRIHFFAVPVIYIVTVWFLWTIPVPLLAGFNCAELISIPVMVFYWRLSKPIFVAMLVLTLGCFLTAKLMLNNGVSLWAWSLGLFAVAWVFQFIGHNIEGKKPSFFRDLFFLLIGPAWVMLEITEMGGKD
jgi:uncharacterized membrane protein YGL010W